jgi:hypothetical protein
MWNWFNCYLSGRHEYGVWCEPGAIFLRCVHCGRRSSGWAMDSQHAHPATPHGAVKKVEKSAPRVAPFNHAASN